MIEKDETDMLLMQMMVEQTRTRERRRALNSSSSEFAYESDEFFAFGCEHFLEDIPGKERNEGGYDNNDDACEDCCYSCEGDNDESEECIYNSLLLLERQQQQLHLSETERCESSSSTSSTYDTSQSQCRLEESFDRQSSDSSFARIGAIPASLPSVREEDDKKPIFRKNPPPSPPPRGSETWKANDWQANDARWRCKV
mmetsp:Transcript_8880/g.14935  ORF Transcript_8880/g.14935 Transcript_8880/m.14935 type:complete len:199 (-) Transcript_8880:128-724(-)